MLVEKKAGEEAPGRADHSASQHKEICAAELHDHRCATEDHRSAATASAIATMGIATPSRWTEAGAVPILGR